MDMHWVIQMWVKDQDMSVKTQSIVWLALGYGLGLSGAHVL